MRASAYATRRICSRKALMVATGKKSRRSRADQLIIGSRKRGRRSGMSRGVIDHPRVDLYVSLNDTFKLMKRVSRIFACPSAGTNTFRINLSRISNRERIFFELSVSKSCNNIRMVNIYLFRNSLSLQLRMN